MQIAVRYKDGTKNLLEYEPCDEYTCADMMRETKEYMEKTTNKPVSVVLVQVVDSQVAEKQLA